MTTARITAAVSPSDPRVCAFTLDRPLHPAPALCRTPGDAPGSPLFEEIFKLPGVAQVMVDGDRVTVACLHPPDWTTLARDVGAALRRALAAGRPPVAPGFAAVPRGDLAQQVTEVLNRELNPGLAQHGGRAELESIEGGVARVRFAGGCQGCGAARMTLAYGIRQTLLDRVPGLKDVEDVTDHAAGAAPYYAPGDPGPSPFR